MKKIYFFQKIFGNKGEQLTIEKVKNFFRYSEVTNITGRSRRAKLAFGNNINFGYTFENEIRIYDSITLYSWDKWAHISIENENIKYQYTENGDLRSIIDTPVTTNKKEIALITKIIIEWYRELKLPDSIDEIQKQKGKQDAVSVVKEIKLDAFGDKVILRIFSDGKTFLLFNMFPPRKVKLTRYQEDNFEKLLAKVTKKKVIHDDRELFIIFDDSQKMIDNVIEFLRDFK